MTSSFPAAEKQGRSMLRALTGTPIGVITAAATGMVLWWILTRAEMAEWEKIPPRRYVDIQADVIVRSTVSPQRVYFALNFALIGGGFGGGIGSIIGATSAIVRAIKQRP